MIYCGVCENLWILILIFNEENFRKLFKKTLLKKTNKRNVCKFCDFLFLAQLFLDDVITYTQILLIHKVL